MEKVIIFQLELLYTNYIDGQTSEEDKFKARLIIPTTIDKTTALVLKAMNAQKIIHCRHYNYNFYSHIFELKV